jgi:hypothetical protein
VAVLEAGECTDALRQKELTFGWGLRSCPANLSYFKLISICPPGSLPDPHVRLSEAKPLRLGGPNGNWSKENKQYEMGGPRPLRAPL